MIAKSYSKGHGTGKRFIRKYPMGTLFGHPIGYSFVATASPNSRSPTTPNWPAKNRNSARSSTS